MKRGVTASIPIENRLGQEFMCASASMRITKDEIVVDNNLGHISVKTTEIIFG
jgi:hypothetical protein